MYYEEEVINSPTIVFFLPNANADLGFLIHGFIR
jgi:hypothetical protein